MGQSVCSAVARLFEIHSFAVGARAVLHADHVARFGFAGTGIRFHLNQPSRSYVAVALLGTGATGITQGVEWGVKEKINFIGKQPKLAFTGEPMFGDFLRKVNQILVDPTRLAARQKTVSSLMVTITLLAGSFSQRCTARQDWLSNPLQF